MARCSPVAPETVTLKKYLPFVLEIFPYSTEVLCSLDDVYGHPGVTLEQDTSNSRVDQSVADDQNVKQRLSCVRYILIGQWPLIISLT